MGTGFAMNYRTYDDSRGRGRGTRHQTRRVGGTGEGIVKMFAVCSDAAMSQPSTRPTLYKSDRFPAEIVSRCVSRHLLEDTDEVAPPVRNVNINSVVTLASTSQGQPIALTQCRPIACTRQSRFTGFAR
jgi:hypothetical protein